MFRFSKFFKIPHVLNERGFKLIDNDANQVRIEKNVTHILKLRLERLNTK